MKQEIKERIEKIKKGEVPEGYKRSSVGIIPKDWETYRLKEVTKSIDYGTSSPTNSKNGFAVIRMGNMINSRIDTNDLVYAEIPYDEYEKLKLNKGDLLINRTNSYELVGKTAIFELDGDFVFASYIVRVLLDKEKVEPKFVNYFMNLDKSQMLLKVLATKGVQQANLNPTVLKQFFKLTIPTEVIEQQKIAQIISIWDRAIELKEKLINEKKEYKKGLMQNLLSGKIRLPGFEGEWKKTNIGEVLDFAKKEPVKNPQDYYLLTVKLHVKGIEATNKKPNITEKGRPYYLREPNELLIGRQNFHNGGIGIVPEDMKGFVASNAISSMYAKKGLLKFYFYCFSNENFYKKIEHIIGGTGQKEISESMIKKLKIVIPKDLKEQQAIVNILSTADKEIELLEEELEALKQQKRGLMQLLLTGIVRVN